MKITVRAPSRDEIQILNQEISQTPNIVYVSPFIWKRAHLSYILHSGKAIAGICSTFSIGKWTKLGPLIVLERFRGRGYGKLLIKRALEDNHKRCLYAGSSNPVVITLLEQHRFHQVRSVFHLPFTIVMFFLGYIILSVNPILLKEFIRKNKQYSRGPYKHFIRT